MKIKPFSKELVKTLYIESGYQDLTYHVLDTLFFAKEECCHDIPEDNYSNLKEKFEKKLELIESDIFNTMDNTLNTIKNSDFYYIVCDVKNRVDPKNEREFIETLDNEDIFDEKKYIKLKKRYTDYMKEIEFTLRDEDLELCSVNIGKYFDDIEEDDEDDDDLKDLYSGFCVCCSSNITDDDKESIQEYPFSFTPDLSHECNIFIFSAENSESEIVQKEITEALNKGILAISWSSFDTYLNQNEDLLVL